jgi:uroporphyrinogen decarboxylase-like protein
MTKREIVKAAYEFNNPPYVPWEMGFTQDAAQKLKQYYGCEDLTAETEHLIDMGRNGGYIFAPAHAVEGDVPVENMVAFINTVQAQKC